MYNPKLFKKSSLDKLHDFIEAHNFATVITNIDKKPMASHLPLLLNRSQGANGTLVGHCARANPQWKTFSDEQDILCIFHGPHAYISAGWYVEEIDVPTWNYTVVHTYGRAKLIEDKDGLNRILKDTVTFQERNLNPPWTFDMPEEERAGLLKAIIGFEIEIKELEGKFKLSQNRTEKDRLGAIKGLSKQQDENSQSIVALMKQESEKK